MAETMDSKMRKRSVRAYDLWLTPVPEETLKEMEKTPEVELALAGCEKQPEMKIWNTLWEIRQRKGDKALVGSLQFLGAPVQGKIAIQFQILPRFRNHRYATDAIRGVTTWALAQKGVYEIEAKADLENDAAAIVLDRAGFVMREHDRKEASYSITRQRTSWVGLYMIIGILIGGIIGVMLNSMVMGVAIGLFLCVATGASMDAKERKEEEAATGKKNGVSHRKKKKDLDAQAEDNQESEAETEDEAKL